MKPQPMSYAEIGLIYSRLTDKARKLHDPRHGDVASLARAIIAARDAQWAAMIGEPVAWFKHGPYEDGEPLMCAFDDPNDDVCFSPIYAIKETP